LEVAEMKHWPIKTTNTNNNKNPEGENQKG